MPPPEPSPPRRHGWPRRFARFLRRLLLVLVLMGVAAAAWLQWFGFPRSVIEALIHQAARQGILLDIGRMDLRFDEGVTAREVVWYSPRDPLFPMFTAGKARFGLSWRNLLAGRLDATVLDEIELSGCTLQHQMGVGNGRKVMKIDGLQTRLRLVPDGLVVHQLKARILHFDTLMRGRVVDRGGGSGKIDIARAVETIQKSLEEIESVYRLLDRVEYTAPPGLELDFDVDTLRPADGTVRLALNADAPFTVHGQRFDSAVLHGRMHEGRLQVDAAKVVSQTGRFELSGGYDLKAGRISAHVRSSLHPDQLLALSPSGLRDELAGLRVSFSGGFQVEVAVDDVPLAEAHRKFSGHVNLQGARCRNVLAEQAGFDVVRDGDRIELRNISGRMGEGVDAGPFSGTFSVNLGHKDFQLDFQSGFDPWVILPFLGPETEASSRGWSPVRHRSSAAASRAACAPTARCAPPSAARPSPAP
ncbi:MAG: hypothetical protein U1F77_14330 [Kiritimatiellia bacterium]